MKNIPLVMTVIGPDRPGLVELLAARVAEHGGNWLESRMAHLGGHFAGILSIHVPAEQEQALLNALHELKSQEVTVVAHSGSATEPLQAQPHASLEIVGHDRPGIVREISRVLARHLVNVVELETECVSAPMSGEPLFKARATLHIPASSNLLQLRNDLEKIAQELMADIKLDELAAAERNET
jgi:glycine cleavage system regulatory protein